MQTWKYYCAICWQEFDDPAQHPKKSIFGYGEQLNGNCAGDVQLSTDRIPGARIKKQPYRDLPFPEDSISIK